MASLLRRASRPKERPGEISSSPSASPREPERAGSSPLTASPRRASRAKDDDGTFEISELMKQVMDWKRTDLLVLPNFMSPDRYQAECDAHQKTRERLRTVETELNALKGLPPPAAEEARNSPVTPRLVATIPVAPLQLPSGSPPSAPSSPSSTPASPTPSSAPSTPTSAPAATASPSGNSASPNFFRTTGRQMGRLLAGGGSSSQRGERRTFGVRLEAVMSSPSDVPRAISQALGYLADSVTADEIDPALKAASLGELKHQVERGATIDLTAGADGKQKAQLLVFRFLVELPEPLIPADAAQQLVTAQAIPNPAWRHRRLYVTLMTCLSPLQKGVFDAYFATLCALVAKSAKAAPAAPPVNPEAEQLDRTVAHLEATIQRIIEAATRQSSPDTLTAAREFAKDVQDLTDRADKRLSPSSPPSLPALRNEFSRHSKAAMGQLKNVLTAAPGVLPLQIGLMKEGCERVKSSATALRNLLAPPVVAPALDENVDRKKATAAKLARLFSSAMFGGTDDAPLADQTQRAPLVKQTSDRNVFASQTANVYATFRGRGNKDAARGRHSESGDTSGGSPAPPSVTSAMALSSFFGAAAPPTPAAVTGATKVAVIETLLMEWSDIMAVEKVTVTAVEEGRTALNASSLDICIDRVLEPVPQDPDFRPLLLRTHVYVLSNEDFLSQLLSRYATSPSTNFDRETNSTIEATLKLWFSSCLPPSPEPLLEKLKTFSGQTTGSLRFMVADLIALSKAAAVPPSLSGSTGADEPSTPFPGVKVASTLCCVRLSHTKLRLDSAFVDVMSRDPEELAQQLLLIDLEMFQAIPVNEFLLGNTAKGRAPFHSRLVEAYNAWARWIGGEVLNTNDAQRADCLTQAIKIADTCRKIGDFNAAFALYCGISFASITRLEALWQKVPKKWMEKYEELRELFSSKQDFKNLRSEMKKLSPATVVVPYTGLYTKWLVAIEENNRTFQENNLVNLTKLRLIWRLCREIQNYQGRGVAPYLPNPELKRLLTSMKPLTEDQLWDKSLLIEPSTRPARSRTGTTSSSSDLTAVLPSTPHVPPMSLAAAGASASAPSSPTSVSLPTMSPLSAKAP